MPTNGGSGGNTTTAAAARKFYNSPELRSRVVALCPPDKVYYFEEALFTSKSGLNRDIFKYDGLAY